MRRVSRLFGGATVAAFMLVSAVPANAGWRRPPPPPRHYHHGGNDSGAVIGVIAAVGLIGLLAAASSAKKKEREARERAADRDYAPRVEGPRDVGTPNGGPGYAGPRDLASGSDEGRPAMGSREEAVDACALAARDEGTRLGGYAEMRGITGSNERGDGWDVTGTIVQRASYGAVGQLRDFRCAYQGGRVEDVALS